MIIFFSRGVWRIAENPRDGGGINYPQWSCFAGPEREPQSGDLVFRGCCSPGWRDDLKARGMSSRHRDSMCDEIIPAGEGQRP